MNVRGGTAVMFNVIHARGFPLEDCQESLFVNFRFLVAKIIPRIRSLLQLKQSMVKPNLAS